MSTLKCINNKSKRFHTFQSNSLMAIPNGYLTYEWQYVNRDDDNAEDDGSKSLKLDVMLKNDR